MKKSFILHLDSLTILDEMTDEQAGIFIKSIYHYHKNNELPELNFAMKMAINPFINQFKRDKEKWEEQAKKNRENGIKGGRKAKNNPVGYVKTIDNTCNLTDQKPTGGQSGQVGAVNVSVNGNDNVSVTPPIIPPNSVKQIDDFLNDELDSKIHQSVFSLWKQLAKELNIKFTQEEWDTIYGYCGTRHTLPVHIIKSNIILLDKWANEGLDIISGLLKSFSTRTLIQPYMEIKTDAKGNRYNRQACILRRQEQIKKEQK